MTQPSNSSPYPAPGEVVGESWMVEKVLGEGGMGCVARAYHTVLHTPVALKFMNPQFMIFPGAVERFINEGKASGRIKSEHVVPVMDARRLPNGTPYLVMECLEGLDLDALLSRDGAPGLPAERAVHFVVQILRGLQAAHGLGIVHRDMKPANCFVVTKDGEPDFVKILDFGISKIEQPGAPKLTRTNSTLGTPLYMSPEQAQRPREVDARTDLYSTGAILYELLTGRAPFFSEGIELLEVLVKLVTAEPPPVRSLRPDLPEGLAAAIHRALARDPSDRYASALAMAEALFPFGTARSAHVVERMRAYKPPAAPSFAPPRELPPSMEAFSRLDRPTGEGPRPAAATAETMFPTDAELLEGPAGVRPAPGAPAGTVLIAPATATETLPAPESEAEFGTARETVPAPAFDAFPPSQALPSGRGRRPRSPLIYALPIVAAFGLLGAVAGVMRRGAGGEAGREGGAPSSTAPASRGGEVRPAEMRPAPSATPGGGEPASPPSTDLTALAPPSGAPGVPSASGKPPRSPPRSTTPRRDPGFDPGIKN